MPVDLPLQDMTLTDKLGLLEALWDDLSRRPDELLSPAWHGEVLAERRRDIESGADSFVDWESAKEDIRRQIS